MVSLILHGIQIDLIWQAYDLHIGSINQQTPSRKKKHLIKFAPSNCLLQ